VFTRLFRFRGGIHPATRKDAAARPIESLPIPARLYVPLQQHIGTPAVPVVRPGQRVAKGDLLGRADGLVSAPVHAPTSGQITGIRERTAPHPSGLPVLSVILDADGEDRWRDDLPKCDNPLALSPAEVAKRVGAAGVVGLGGAGFPSAVKLAPREPGSIRTLIVNGAECEPYLSCDDRIMRERATGIVAGIRLMLHALGAKRAIVAIERNKPEATAAMRAAAGNEAGLAVIKVPTRYPMGSEKQIIQTVTGTEVPAGGLGSDIGVVVHNVGTAWAIFRAVRFGEPLVSRVLTVGGGAVREPSNLELPVGTLVSEVIAHCGGFRAPPARLLMGGPMMGHALPSAEVPVVKGSNGLIALDVGELSVRRAGACIRCGRCVDACPIGLMPSEMAARIRVGNLTGAVSYGLVDCIGCGSCAYVCPAHIPLAHYFNHARGELAERQRSEHKANETRKLAEARTARRELQRRKKVEAAAKRKKTRAASRLATDKESAA
jgi:electron transport complex protein RnfC